MLDSLLMDTRSGTPRAASLVSIAFGAVEDEVARPTFPQATRCRGTVWQDPSVPRQVDLLEFFTRQRTGRAHPG